MENPVSIYLQQVRTPSGLSKQSKTFFLLNRLFLSHQRTIPMIMTNSLSRIYRARHLLSLHTLSCSQCREMLFPRRSWLWLYIIVGVSLGHELSNSQPHGEKSCYRLYMLNCNFNEADNYCKTQEEQLTLTWNQGLQTHIQSIYRKETTWWVGTSLQILGKRQEATHSGRALV